MNERIKELAVEAIVKNIASNEWVFTDEELVKFIELFVEESIMVMKLHDYHGEWLGEKIKSHFGIPFESKYG